MALTLWQRRETVAFLYSEDDSHFSSFTRGFSEVFSEGSQRVLRGFSEVFSEGSPEFALSRLRCSGGSGRTHMNSSLRRPRTVGREGTSVLDCFI